MVILLLTQFGGIRILYMHPFFVTLSQASYGSMLVLWGAAASGAGEMVESMLVRCMHILFIILHAGSCI